MHQLFLGRVLFVGSTNPPFDFFVEQFQSRFPGLDIAICGQQPWQQFILERLRHDVSLILVTDNDHAPTLREVTAILRLQRNTTPVVMIGVSGRMQQAIDALKNGAEDYLIVSESSDELNLAFERLRPYLPKAQAFSQPTVETLLQLFTDLPKHNNLSRLLHRNLRHLMTLARARHGLILLKTMKSFVVGAFDGMTEDNAVLVAASKKGPIPDADSNGIASIFETPEKLPGDNPALWALHEASLKHGYLIPLISARGQNRGIAILGTQNVPTGQVQWPLIRAGQAIADAIELVEIMSKTEERERSATLRLKNYGIELDRLVTALTDFSTKTDLHSIAQHLFDAASLFLKPDIMGVYLSSGRARFHDVHEAHPLALSSVQNFEQCFNSRLYSQFGDEALKHCPSTSISKSQRLADAAKSGATAVPTHFDNFECVWLPSEGEPIGAFAIATAVKASFGDTQRELLKTLANLAFRSVRQLSVTQDERQTIVQSLLDGLPVGVALLDAFGRIVLANKPGAELLKAAGTVSADNRLLELCGEHFYDATAGIDQSGFSFSRERAVNGRVFFVSIASVPLPSALDVEQPLENTESYFRDHGMPMPQTGYTVALRDVTEQHQVRQQLNQAEKLSTIGVMVSGVAHELNNPLTSVRGFAELLVENPNVSDSVRRDLERIRKNAARCARIVQDLLAFSRKSRLEQPVDIPPAGLLREVFDLMVFELKRSGVTLKRDFDRVVPSISGDPHQLQQVFVNLINNAAQAIEETGRAGTITVRLRNAGDRICIVIEDTGPGIRPELLNRIFDPFFTTKSSKGTGLGLSICYGIVRDHGGKLRAESPAGCGARFTVELPCSAQQSSQVTDDQEQESSELDEVVGADEVESTEPETRERLILVVDNTPVVRRLVMSILTAAGYNVDVAANAEEALATMKFMQYDCVLTSLRLPGVRGPSLFHMLNDKDSYHADRTIFMLDSRDHEDTRAGFLLQKNAPEVVYKPFSHQALIDAVEKVIRRSV